MKTTVKLGTIALVGRDWTGVTAFYGEYANGGPSLQLLANDGSPLCTASVWVPGLQDGEIGIKDWSENKGILDQLVSLDLVAPPHRHIPSGYVMVAVCKLVDWEERYEAKWEQAEKTYLGHTANELRFLYKNGLLHSELRWDTKHGPTKEEIKAVEAMCPGIFDEERNDFI